MYYQANTGHDVSVRGVATITQFYDAMLNGTTFPDLAWTKEADGTLTVTWAEPGGTAKLWEATSPNRDFRESRFASTPLEGDGEVRVTPDMPTEGWKAYYVEVTWPGAMGMPFGLTTEMVVMPDSFPEEGTRTYDLIDETEAGPGDQAKAE